MAVVVEIALTKEEALLIISGCCFNQMLRHKVRFDIPDIKSSYDVVREADQLFRAKYGKNCQDLKDQAEKTLKE